MVSRISPRLRPSDCLIIPAILPAANRGGPTRAAVVALAARFSPETHQISPASHPPHRADLEEPAAGSKSLDVGLTGLLFG